MRTLALIAVLTAVIPDSYTLPTHVGRDGPVVRSDTIYALALKPSDYHDRDVVNLLDDETIRFDSVGRETQTWRQVIQVLSDQRVKDQSERHFSYHPGRERLTLHWARVLNPDGTVVSASPSHVEETDVPQGTFVPLGRSIGVGDSGQKDMTVSLSGLKAGMLIDISVTQEELHPYWAGDFLESLGPDGITPYTLRYRRALDLPASVVPHIVESHLQTPRTTHIGNGRTIYTWTANDVLPAGLFASDTSSMQIEVSGPTTWASVAQWYAAGARDRYTASPGLVRQVHELVAGASSLDDSIARVQHWIAHDLRNDALPLGTNGYQPRLPDSVLVTRSGDNKDKTTLFIAALHTMGVTAYPVLVNDLKPIDRQLPSYKQFNHIIAAVKRPSRYQFADLIQPLKEYAEALPELGGYFGLVVFPDGTSEEITLPRVEVTDNVDSISVAGTVDTTGIFRGRYEEWFHGTLMTQMRRQCQTLPTPEQRAAYANSLAQRYAEDASGDSLVTCEGKSLGRQGKSLSRQPSVRAVIIRARVVTDSSGARILTFENRQSTAAGQQIINNVIDRLTKDAADTASHKSEVGLALIEIQNLFGAQQIQTLHMTLPQGWIAALPRPIDVRSVFGNYSFVAVQNGRELRITRSTSGPDTPYPQDRVSDLVVWLRTYIKDFSTTSIVLKRSTP